ncbi:carbonic anhydrase [Candidatus Desantisbacteria bacterium]|nr:carbonic anhydrase [Candidatus Desantisbacteria bacterium]
MKKYVLKNCWLVLVLVVSLNSFVLANEKEVSGHSSGHHSEEGVSPDTALSKLEEVYTGQKPYAIILSCSDSRVVPEYIFDAGLGEIFIIRTAGNVIDPIVLGSIEYAAAHLGAKLLIVMGHEKCGAVTAAVNHTNESINITAMLNAIKPAVEAMEKAGEKDNMVEKTIVENANVMVKRVTEESSIIAGLVKEGKFKIVSAKYFLKDGHVEFKK